MASSASTTPSPKPPVTLEPVDTALYHSPGETQSAPMQHVPQGDYTASSNSLDYLPDKTLLAPRTPTPPSPSPTYISTAPPVRRPLPLPVPRTQQMTLPATAPPMQELTIATSLSNTNQGPGADPLHSPLPTSESQPALRSETKDAERNADVRREREQERLSRLSEELFDSGATEEGVPRYEAERRSAVGGSMAHDHLPSAPGGPDARTWGDEKRSVEQWRREQSRAQSEDLSSSHMRQRANSLRSASSSGGGRARRRQMTDAEIAAQHHFREAQKHLEMAQRLAVAAATRQSTNSTTASSLFDDRLALDSPRSGKDSSGDDGNSTFDDFASTYEEPFTTRESEIPRASPSHHPASAPTTLRRQLSNSNLVTSPASYYPPSSFLSAGPMGSSRHRGSSPSLPVEHHAEEQPHQAPGCLSTSSLYSSGRNSNQAATPITPAPIRSSPSYEEQISSSTPLPVDDLSSSARSPAVGIEGEFGEFHGFRPRLGPSYGAYAPSPAHYATPPPGYQPAAAPPPPAAYTSFLPPPAPIPIRQQTLPIHQQPLQYDHSLLYTSGVPRVPPIPAPYLHQVQPVQQPFKAPNANSTSSIGSGIAPAHSGSPSYSPHNNSSPRNQSPSNFNPGEFGLTRPPSVTSSRSTGSGIKGRMMSLRERVMSPHVRFKSPTPEDWKEGEEKDKEIEGRRRDLAVKSMEETFKMLM